MLSLSKGNLTGGIMEKSYKFHIGLHVDGSKNTPAQVSGRKARAIEIAMAALIDGFTVTDTNGYWERKFEPGIVIESITALNPDYEYIANYMRSELQQVCILVTITEPEVHWITQ
jgi:hypothetical protein